MEFVRSDPVALVRRRAVAVTVAFLLGLAAAAAAVPSPPIAASVSADGGDASAPFPIDMGGRSGAPSTYKGLPLGLHRSGSPRVDVVDGTIGVVCIGMSNGNQECGDFIARSAAGQFAGVDPRVRVANCAVGSHAIERWNDPAYDAVLWDACVDAKIPRAGLRPDQVRVVWHKAASQNTSDGTGGVLPPYPDPASDYFRFYASLETFARRLAEKLPSVQAVYSSSRSYGGFSGRPQRGEPLSYEEGLALNAWLAARASSTAAADRGPAASRAADDGTAGAWHGWGPYLWAPDCATGVRNGSGVCYDRSDYVDDGVHPSPSGREKVSRMLDRRFRQDAWYAPPRTYLPLAVRP